MKEREGKRKGGRGSERDRKAGKGRGEIWRQAGGGSGREGRVVTGREEITRSCP